MIFKYVALNTIGNSTRNNDDRVLINKTLVVDDVVQGECQDRILSIVCDGVGGENGGFLAAELASKTFKNVYPSNLDKDQIYQSLLLANETIENEQSKHKEYNHMLTTITGIIINHNSIIGFNLGDTRLYRFRNGFLCQLSEDHSLSNELVFQGYSTDSEIVQKNKNVITKALGLSQFDEPSFYENPNGVINGDIYLLCSDGLHGYITSNEISDVLKRQNITLVDKAILLKNIALKNQSYDNISIVIIEVNQNA